MDVGIVTRYQHRDVTLAAIQLCDLFAPLGRVHILTTTPVPPRLHQQWDRRVMPVSLLPRRRAFTTWFKIARPRLMIWTEAPALGQVAYANARGCMTVLVATCREDEDAIRRVYPEFSRVVAPSRAALDVLTYQFKLNNVVAAPWSPMRAVTRKRPGPPGPMRYHVPLAGSMAAGVPAEAVGMMRSLMAATPCEFTVSHSHWAPATLRMLVRLAREVPRLTLVKAGVYDSHLVELAAHDATVVLSQLDPFGMSALCSLHMGTPVIAYKTPPMNEIVRDLENGVLVTGGDDAAGALARMEGTLHEIAVDTGLLARTRDWTFTGLVKRRRAFEKAWIDIANNVA